MRGRSQWALTSSPTPTTKSWEAHASTSRASVFFIDFKGPRGQPDWTRATWIQPVRHPWEVCHLAYRGARERCVFGVTYSLCKATWQRTIFSPKKNWIYGGATEPHYLFSSKLMALRPFSSSFILSGGAQSTWATRASALKQSRGQDHLARRIESQSA